MNRKQKINAPVVTRSPKKVPYPRESPQKHPPQRKETHFFQRKKFTKGYAETDLRVTQKNDPQLTKLWNKTKQVIPNINENFETIEKVLNRYQDSLEKRRIIEIFDILTQSKTDEKYAPYSDYHSIKMKLKSGLVNELMNLTQKMTGKRITQSTSYNKDDPLETYFFTSSVSLVDFFLFGGLENSIKGLFPKPSTSYMTYEEWDSYVLSILSIDSVTLWKVFRPKIHNNIKIIYGNFDVNTEKTMDELDKFLEIFTRVAKEVTQNEKTQQHIGSEFAMLAVASHVILVAMAIFYMLYSTNVTGTGSNGPHGGGTRTTLKVSESGSVELKSSDVTSVFEDVSDLLIQQVQEFHGGTTRKVEYAENGVDFNQINGRTTVKKMKELNEKGEELIESSSIAFEKLNEYEKFFRSAIGPDTMRRVTRDRHMHVSVDKLLIIPFTEMENYVVLPSVSGDISYNVTLIDNSINSIISGTPQERKQEIKSTLKIILRSSGLDYSEDKLENLYKKYETLYKEDDLKFTYRMGAIFVGDIKTVEILEDFTVSRLSVVAQYMARSIAIDLVNSGDVRMFFDRHIREFSSPTLTDVFYRLDNLYYQSVTSNTATSPIISSLLLPVEGTTHQAARFSESFNNAYYHSIRHEFRLSEQKTPFTTQTPLSTRTDVEFEFSEVFYLLITQVFWLTGASLGYAAGRDIIGHYFGENFNNIIRLNISTMNTYFTISRILTFGAMFAKIYVHCSITGISPTAIFGIGIPTGASLISTLWRYYGEAGLIKSDNEIDKKSYMINVNQNLGQILSMSYVYLLDTMGKHMFRYFNELQVPYDDNTGELIAASLKKMDNLDKLYDKEALTKIFGYDEKNEKNPGYKFVSQLGRFVFKKQEHDIEQRQKFLYQCYVLKYTFNNYHDPLKPVRKGLIETIFIFILASYIETWAEIDFISKLKKFNRNALFSLLLKTYHGGNKWKQFNGYENEEGVKVKGVIEQIEERLQTDKYKYISNEYFYRKNMGALSLSHLALLPFRLIINPDDMTSIDFNKFFSLFYKYRYDEEELSEIDLNKRFFREEGEEIDFEDVEDIKKMEKILYPHKEQVMKFSKLFWLAICGGLFFSANIINNTAMTREISLIRLKYIQILSAVTSISSNGYVIIHEKRLIHLAPEEQELLQQLVREIDSGTDFGSATAATAIRLIGNWVSAPSQFIEKIVTKIRNGESSGIVSPIVPIEPIYEFKRFLKRTESNEIGDVGLVVLPEFMKDYILPEGLRLMSPQLSDFVVPIEVELSTFWGRVLRLRTRDFSLNMIFQSVFNVFHTVLSNPYEVFSQTFSPILPTVQSPRHGTPIEYSININNNNSLIPHIIEIEPTVASRMRDIISNAQFFDTSSDYYHRATEEEIPEEEATGEDVTEEEQIKEGKQEI